MSLLTLSRVAAFQLLSKAEILSSREGRKISFLKTALFMAPQITLFHFKPRTMKDREGDLGSWPGYLNFKLSIFRNSH